MAKRKETIALENMLTYDTRKKRIYGCEEVTIGFYRDGLGNEHVDFMTFDGKESIKCYEIKVTMEDLKSHAKKSFYGHYNYLVVTSELYKKIKDSNINLENYGIPSWVGIMVGYYSIDSDSKSIYWCDFESKRKAKKQNISDAQFDMLRASLIRTLYWKMDKYKSTADGTSLKQAKKEASKYKKDFENERERRRVVSNGIYRMSHMIEKKFNVRFHIYEDFTPDEWVEAISNLIRDVSQKRKG